jgi:NAD(P)-dependent dehydrogenase (short-subunit alcohol dehydrogenase family)
MLNVRPLVSDRPDGPGGSWSRLATIVTGGASGIGRAAVELFRKHGAEVLSVDLDPVGAESAEASGAHFHRADVSTEAGWESIMEAAGRTLGHADVLFLNAGVPVLEPDVLTADLDRVARAYAVNVGGVLHGLRAGVPVLERHGGGDVVVTASLAAVMPYWSDPCYAMTKHAVLGLARSVAPKLLKRGVRVNVLCPGVIDTPILPDHISAAMRAAGLAPLPPADVAEHLLEVLAAGGSGRIWLSQTQLGLVEYTPAPVPMPVPQRT